MNPIVMRRRESLNDDTAERDRQAERVKKIRATAPPTENGTPNNRSALTEKYLAASYPGGCQVVGDDPDIMLVRLLYQPGQFAQVKEADAQGRGLLAEAVREYRQRFVEGGSAAEVVRLRLRLKSLRDDAAKYEAEAEQLGSQYDRSALNALPEALGRL